MPLLYKMEKKKKYIKIMTTKGYLIWTKSLFYESSKYEERRV